VSEINGVAGAYAERPPVFHLMGTPAISTQAARALMHHTLGNGEYIPRDFLLWRRARSMHSLMILQYDE
jgi:TPP-dependent 2-oxoacid decarboxylase